MPEGWRGAGFRCNLPEQAVWGFLSLLPGTGRADAALHRTVVAALWLCWAVSLEQRTSTKVKLACKSAPPALQPQSEWGEARGRFHVDSHYWGY